MWTTFFFNYYPELILNGNIYVGIPPIFKLTKGDKHRYIYTEQEYKNLKDKDKWHIQYLKGLGEMNPDQLWESTLNPETRKLYKLTIEDAEKCAKAVNDIMGKDSEARKKLVLNNFTIEG